MTDQDAHILTFEDADRRCRSRTPPRSRDLVARAAALDRLGRPGAAGRDIEVAAGWSTGELDVERAILLRGGRARRLASASAMLGRDGASRRDVAASLACLARSGTRLLLTALRGVEGARVSVYAVRPDPVAITVHGDAGFLARLGPRAPTPVPSEAGWWTVSFDLVCADADPIHLRASSRDAQSEPVILYPCAAGPTGDQPAWDGAAGEGVTGIVPIYGDPVSLSACLASLATQRHPGLRFVVVDDASPVAEVSRLGRDFCVATRGLYLRAGVNAGFAAAVNRALEACRGGNVLILNSDVVLPPGAVGRLARAAARAGVGTVSALSNDAGHTSFPVPFGPNPFPAPEQAEAVDGAARAFNAGRVVDVVSNLGSCLYITRACLDRVGRFSAAYGRGYYEDVDFCLRARERGFRNVAAADLYVAHASGRSFGHARPALVARNRAVLDARFPGFTATATASLAADPLAPARGRIEEVVEPGSAETVLVVGPLGDGLGTPGRLRARARPGATVIAMDWRRRAGAVEIRLQAHPAGQPHALRFRLDADGRARLGAYLARLPNPGAEIQGWDAVPPVLLSTLSDAKVPLSRLVDGAAEVEAVGHATAGGWREAIPADRMAAAALGRREATAEVGSRASPTHRTAALNRLAVAMPMACPAAEAFVVELSRALRPTHPVRLVVLGACLDDEQVMAAGNAHVSGPVAFDDYAELLDHYRVDALLCPYRAAGFGFVDDLSRGRGLPKGYFDWSGGRLAVAPGDLALGHDQPDPEAIGAVAAWCGGARRSGAA